MMIQAAAKATARIAMMTMTHTFLMVGTRLPPKPGLVAHGAPRNSVPEDRFTHCPSGRKEVLAGQGRRHR